MENSTGTANKKSTTSKNYKTEEKVLNKLRRKEKRNVTIKTSNKTRGNKSEITGERKKTEKY